MPHAQGGLLICLLLTAAFVISSHGAVLTWANPAGGLWGDAANWNPAAVPTAVDTVYIDAPSNHSNGIFNISFNGDTHSVAALYLGQFPTISTSIELQGPGVLIVTDFYCGGTISAALNVTVTDGFFVLPRNLTLASPQSCEFDGGASLTTGPEAVSEIWDEVIMGEGIHVYNYGLFYMRGRGMQGTPEGAQVRNYFFNYGFLRMERDAQKHDPWIFAHLINGPVGNFLNNNADVLIFGNLTNSGTVSVGSAAYLSIGGGTYEQTGGLTDMNSPYFSVAAQTDEGIGNITISGGMLMINAQGDQSVILGNLYNTGGTLYVNTSGISCELDGRYTQGPQGVTRILYVSNQGFKPGLLVGSYSGMSEPSCDAEGKLEFIFSEVSSFYPPFLHKFAAVSCPSDNTSSLRYSDVQVSQPSVGAVQLNLTNSNVTITQLYNITLTLKSRVSNNEANFVYSTVISENSVPLHNVMLALHLVNSESQVQLPKANITTGAEGTAELSLQLPGDDVSSVLVASIVSCANLDATQCSLSQSFSFNADDDDPWIESNWWVLLLVLGGVGIVVVVLGGVGYTVWRRRRPFSSYERLPGAGEDNNRGMVLYTDEDGVVLPVHDEDGLLADIIRVLGSLGVSEAIASLLQPLSLLVYAQNVTVCAIPGGQWSVANVWRFWRQHKHKITTLERIDYIFGDILKKAIYVVAEMGFEALAGVIPKAEFRRFDPAEPRSDNPYTASISATCVELGTIALGTLAMHPLTRLRIHMRAPMLRSSSPDLIRCFQDLRRRDGIFNLVFRGAWLSFFQGLLCSLNYHMFGQYYQISHIVMASPLLPTTNNKVLSCLKHAVGVSIDNLLHSVTMLAICVPFQVVQRRMEVQWALGSVNGVTYTSALHCATSIFQNEGIGGFFKGALPQLFEHALPILIGDFIVDMCCNLYYGLPEYSQDEEDSLTAATPYWEEQLDEDDDDNNDDDGDDDDY